MAKRDGRVGVIGGGLGGLAAACTLAARGYEVVLFEKSPWLGGKAAVLEEGGFRFDMGPTILTIPNVLRRVFAEAGKNLDDYLDLIRLDPQWRCFFDDGSTLDLVEDTEAMATRLDGYAPGSGDGYRRFQQLSDRLHRISDKFYFWKSIGGIADMIDVKAGFQPSVLADVLAMRMGHSVAGTVRKYVPDARVAQMLDHFTQYVGSSPYGSPAVLCGIAHMQTNDGVWFPMGGTRAVPESLAKLAEELGVELRPGVGVSRILLNDTRDTVTGVETDSGEQVALAAVVSNADSVRTHRELVNGAAPRAVRRFENRRSYEPACSGVVLYLGLSKRYDHLLHHAFVFSRDPHEEFDFIYKKGEPAPDPTCYLASTSRTEPATAPPGGDALYVLVHTPYLRPHHDWAKLLSEYRRVILNKLKTTGQMPDIEDRIVFERHLTPQDIHDRYRVLNGAIYGLASHGKWLGAFKPANRSPDLKGLYLAGGRNPPRAGDADGADVRVDRRRHARPGPGSPTGAAGSHRVRGISADADADDPTRHRRAWFARGFRDRYALRYVRKHFHAVRLSKASSPIPAGDAPLIVAINHPGWWDPMICTVLSREFGEHREHFAAIDAEMLKKYPFFKMLGFVGVGTHSLRGAAAFLRTATTLLGKPNRVLWVTAQGEFHDVRVRPLGLRSGVGHLAARLERGFVLPVALEYTFWTERTPEALVRIGPAVDVAEAPGHGGREWTARIERALTEALDGLNTDAMSRDPDRFTPLLGGATGVGGMYDGFRRLRAWLTGRRFRPEHADPGIGL